MNKAWIPIFEKFKIKASDDIIFRVFSKDPKEIKIVLLGQDPYPHNADGLSFSSKVGIPGSLRNIFKELNRSFPERNYQFVHGNLERWFDNGIFLLNCSLTIGERKKWTPFIDYIIKYILQDAIFILLGNHAKKKSTIVKTFVTAKHPSPATYGFVGSDIFLKVENALGKQFDWQN